MQQHIPYNCGHTSTFFIYYKTIIGCVNKMSKGPQESNRFHSSDMYFCLSFRIVQEDTMIGLSKELEASSFRTIDIIKWRREGIPHHQRIRSYERQVIHNSCQTTKGKRSILQELVFQVGEDKNKNKNYDAFRGASPFGIHGHKQVRWLFVCMTRVKIKLTNLF